MNLARYTIYIDLEKYVDPGGPVVIILALDSRFAGSNPVGVGRLFQCVKILSMTSFRRE